MCRIKLSLHLQAIAARSQGKKCAFITGNYDCNFPLTKAMLETAKIGGKLQRQTSGSSLIIIPNNLFVAPEIDQNEMLGRMLHATEASTLFIDVSKTAQDYIELIKTKSHIIIDEKRARNRASDDLKTALGKRSGNSHLDTIYMQQTGGIFILDGIIAAKQTTGPACQLILGHLLRELQEVGFEYAGIILVSSEFPCANEGVSNVYKTAYRGTMNVDVLYLPDPELINHPDWAKRSKANLPIQFFSF